MNFSKFTHLFYGAIYLLRTGILLLGFAALSSSAFAQQEAETQPTETEEIEAVETEAVEEEPTEAEIQVEAEAQTHLTNSLLSLSETVTARQKRLADLGREMSRTSKDIDKVALQIEIDALALEITQVEQEMDLVVLGLQARQYSKDNGEQEPVNISEEIARVFEPIIMSIERATEPARRMEELRQLADQAEKRIVIAQNTLDSINGFRDTEVKYPKDVKERLDKHHELWQNRLQEAQNIDIALKEQLAATRRARGNSLKQFSEDFGGFILNRGASLLMAMVLGFGFILLCQIIISSTSYWYRRSHNDVLSASMRIFSMLISLIGIIGGFVIAVTIFNIRQDWLMLAMSLLLALALSWTFVKSLPALGEQTRLLMNLGAVREGERTLVNGLPYRIERLSMYTKLVNPSLSGGEMIYPVRELIGMHSRPVTDGEAWFPTQIGDWIVRDGKHYQVTKQTPEHVIIRRPGGAEDFVPAQEFMDTLFEVISDGYRAVYEFGLDYKHLDVARTEIPERINQCVKDHIGDILGDEALVAVDTRFVGLGDSALSFTVLADVGAGLGSEWKKMQKYLNHAVVEACLTQNWDIPFPQLVVHKG